MRITLLLLAVLATEPNSCNDKKETIKSPENNASTEINKTKELADLENYFKAGGNEPFWSIAISEEKIVFKTPEDSLIAPHVEPIHAMDANVKRYDTQTEMGELSVEITQNDCTNSMSGELLPYSVSVTYKSHKSTQATTFKGCGSYQPDYRLHDIWVLESLNGRKVSASDFSRELPSMELHPRDARFSGYSGCNRMNGELFFDRGLLRFTKVATTRMACVNGSENEQSFLKALQSSTGYRIGNNRLTLFNPDRELLVFKKVD